MLVTTDEHRRKFQERAVALVGLRDQVLRLADAGIGAQGVHAPTDHDRGIEASGGQHRGDHGSRRRLAVHARDRNAVLQTHQFSQHLGAWNYRDVEFVRFDDFGILRRDRRTGDHNFRAGDVFRGMAFEDRWRPGRPGAGSQMNSSDQNRKSCSQGSAAPRQSRSCRCRRCPRNEYAEFWQT